MPHPDDLAFDEKIAFVLDNCSFDEDTILVGHSLGSLIAMKVIEKLSTKIAGFVSIAGMFDWRVTPERKKSRLEKYKDYDSYKDTY